MKYLPTRFLIFCLIARNAVLVKGETQKCDGGDCNCSPRRQLIMHTIWADQLEACGTSTYTLALNADRHLVLVAMPSDQDRIELGCLPVVFHDYSNSEQQYGKEAVVMEFDNYFEDFSLNPETVMAESFIAGSYSLSDLSKAFDAADRLADKGYDVVKNNCATFVLSFGTALGYKLNVEVIQYIIDNMAASDIPDLVRMSSSLYELGENADLLDTIALTRKLVYNYLFTH